VSQVVVGPGPPVSPNEPLGSPLARRERSRPGIEPRGIDHALADEQVFERRVPLLVVDAFGFGRVRSQSVRVRGLDDSIQ
jgi:hypothetical protein